jgi:two-component system response regulator AtoC
MNAKNPSQMPPNSLKDVRLLVVDDEEMLAWSIDTEMKSLGAEVTRAGSIREALDRFGAASPDLVITDLRLPDGNGLELLKKWRFEYPDMPVILITAHGAIDSAVTALRLGAFDYLQKPFNMKDLAVAVKRASEMAKLRQKISRLQGDDVSQTDVEIIGDTPAMQQLKSQLTRIAKSKANTTLILGESGTGKELASRAIHEWGERRGQPFVEINCASIPETLLESELFGYEKGAFTDARERKLGLFEIARNGSIFLDEIGEMPLKLQAKLLRVLEYRRFKRLGGTKDVEFTGRIIAATNRNLLGEVTAGRFRSDLYYRLNVLPVQLPSLRERAADIPVLAEHLCKSLAKELDMPAPILSAAATTKLMQHPWPGNVRELKNVLQRAMVFYEPTTITPDHLELDPVGATPPPPASPSYTAPAAAPVAAPVAPHTTPAAMVGTEFTLPADGVNLESLEKSLLQQALDKARHNQTRAAQLLGITRHTLRYRLEKYGLALPVD